MNAQGILQAIDFSDASDDAGLGLRIVRIENINSKEDLLKAYDKKFEFPYFGFNWDALLDCMRDLSWIEEYRVIIAHPELPNLPNKELIAYLEILVEAKRHLCGLGNHKLTLRFPHSCKQKISKILGIG